MYSEAVHGFLGLLREEGRRKEVFLHFDLCGITFALSREERRGV
jgi:hypothetical protein